MARKFDELMTAFSAIRSINKVKSAKIKFKKIFFGATKHKKSCQEFATLWSCPPSLTHTPLVSVTAVSSSYLKGSLKAGTVTYSFTSSFFVYKSTKYKVNRSFVQWLNSWTAY